MHAVLCRGRTPGRQTANRGISCTSTGWMLINTRSLTATVALAVVFSSVAKNRQNLCKFESVELDYFVAHATEPTGDGQHHSTRAVQSADTADTADTETRPTVTPDPSPDARYRPQQADKSTPAKEALCARASQ